MRGAVGDVVIGIRGMAIFGNGATIKRGLTVDYMEGMLCMSVVYAVVFTIEAIPEGRRWWFGRNRRAPR